VNVTDRHRVHMVHMVTVWLQHVHSTQASNLMDMAPGRWAPHGTQYRVDVHRTCPPCQMHTVTMRALCQHCPHSGCVATAWHCRCVVTVYRHRDHTVCAVTVWLRYTNTVPTCMVAVWPRYTDTVPTPWLQLPCGHGTRTPCPLGTDTVATRRPYTTWWHGGRVPCPHGNCTYHVAMVCVTATVPNLWHGVRVPCSHGNCTYRMATACVYRGHTATVHGVWH